MDFEFIGKLIIFALTFYLLLKYMVECKINTINVVIVFGCVAFGIIVLFLLTNQHNITRCGGCQHSV